MFFYPPRPETSLPSSELKDYGPKHWIGQVKLNGSNASVYSHKKDLQIWNRHKSKLSVKIDLKNLLPKKDWWSLNGEYMNKSQTDLRGKVFNHKFVIFDLLVAKSLYLMGTTFDQRYKMLLDLFQPTHSYDPYLWQIRDNVFLVKQIEGDFLHHYNIISKARMYEGLVVKKKTGIMQSGLRQNNTSLEQFKFRKATKNYTY